MDSTLDVRVVEHGNWKARRKVYLRLAVSVAGMLAAWLLLRHIAGAEALVAHHAALMEWRTSNPNLALALFTLAFVLIAAISLPGVIVLKLTGGYLFGAVFGSVIAVLSATVGATILFLAVRAGIGERILQRQRGRLGKGAVGRICDSLRENELRALFVLRMTPVVPFFISNALPAVLGVRLHNFLISTLIGIIPSAVIFSAIGSGLKEAIASGRLPVVGSVSFFLLLVPALVAAFILAVGVRQRRDPARFDHMRFPDHSAADRASRLQGGMPYR